VIHRGKHENDSLRGAGDDVIFGGGGRDTLKGGRRNDSIDATDGIAEVVRGGPGVDECAVDEGDRVRSCEFFF
jgi:Ca2+-binding RTX toxin-like protein